MSHFPSFVSHLSQSDSYRVGVHFPGYHRMKGLPVQKYPLSWSPIRVMQCHTPIIKPIESNHLLRSSVYRFGLAHIRQCLQQLAFSIPGNFAECGCLLYFGGAGGTFQWRSLTDG